MIGTNTNATDSPHTFTAEKLLAALSALGDVPPDPLCGATVLLCAENMVDAARKLADAVHRIFARPLVMVDQVVPVGHILCMRGGECVRIITGDA